MIFFGALIWFGVLLPSLAHQHDPKITLTVQAANVKSALDTLGASAQVTLLTSPQTADDILALRLVDVTLTEAMERIADVEDAEWKKEKGAIRLVRTARQQQAELNSETNRDVQAYVKAITLREAEHERLKTWSAQEASHLADQVQLLIKDLPSSNPPPAWRKRAQGMVAQSPIFRAVQDIVTSMDSLELANLPDSMRTVWSTRPTPTQRPFSPKVARIIERYVQDQAGWIRAINSRALTAPEIKDNPYWTQQLGDLLGHQNQRIATVLLTAESRIGIEFNLTTYDDQGRQIAHASDSLEGLYPTDASSLRALFPNPEEKPISLEGEDRLLFDYSHKAGVDKRGPPPPELLSKLTDPVHFDPIRLLVSPLLVQVAKVRGVNLVARLPDEVFGFSSLLRGAQIDGSSIFQPSLWRLRT